MMERRRGSIDYSSFSEEELVSIREHLIFIYKKFFKKFAFSEIFGSRYDFVDQNNAFNIKEKEDYDFDKKKYMGNFPEITTNNLNINKIKGKLNYYANQVYDVIDNLIEDVYQIDKILLDKDYSKHMELIMHLPSPFALDLTRYHQERLDKTQKIQDRLKL